MRKKDIPLEIIISLHEEGLYDREIADILGCTRHNITARLNKAGYNNRKTKIDDLDLRNRISNSLVGQYVGKNNPNYNGNSTLYQVARGICKTFKKRKLRNNENICALCGTHEGPFEIHHIRPFIEIMKEFQETYDGNKYTLYEQLTSFQPFMDEDNLVILCEKCHTKFHSKDNHELSLQLQKSATTIPKGSRTQAVGVRSAEGLDDSSL